MRQVLDAARDSVEGELSLRRALKVQTAQAKLSAQVVSVMPFALVAVFSLVSEDFLAPFFASASGWALLALALGMQAAGCGHGAARAGGRGGVVSGAEGLAALACAFAGVAARMPGAGGAASPPGGRAAAGGARPGRRR